MSNSKRNLLPVLLLAKVGQVVVAKEAVRNAALAHSLLAKHHKPVIKSWQIEKQVNLLQCKDIETLVWAESQKCTGGLLSSPLLPKFFK